MTGVQTCALPISEWDEHGNPVQAGAAPIAPKSLVPNTVPTVPPLDWRQRASLYGNTLGGEAKGLGEGLYGATVGVGKAMTPHTTGDWAASLLGPAGLAAKNIGVPMAQDIGRAGKFYYDWATGGQPVGTGTDRSNILPSVLGAAPRALGQAGGMMIGGKAIEGGTKTAADYDALRKGMDITGKLVKNADRGANVSQGLLGVYQGKIVPTLAAAVERVKAPMNAAWEQYKQVAQAAQGDTKVPGTALLQRADKFMDEHPGISDNARTFYNKTVERLNPQSIESLNRLKGVVYKLANGKGTPGIDAKFYNEIYHGINDALKEHADSIGAGSVLDDAMKHSKAYYDLKHGLVDDMLDTPVPRQGEHISMLNDLFAKDGEVARSISKQLHDPVLARNYGLSDLGDAFDRNLAYANQLYKGLSSYAKGFSGLFKSAADHPVAALTAYELLRSQNWIVRLVGVSKVAHMMNALEAGNALRTIRGEITDPMAFQEGFARGTAPKAYAAPGAKPPTPPSGSPAAPDMPRGPLTPEERATWASKAKPVGADVLRGTGGQPVTYGTSEEMLRGLRKALGQETPEAKRAFEASEAKKAAKSKEK